MLLVVVCRGVAWNDLQLETSEAPTAQRHLLLGNLVFRCQTQLLEAN